MASVGSLVVDLVANTASFTSNIEKAAANLNSNAAKMNASLRNIEHGFKSVGEGAKLLVEALAVERFAEMTKGALEFAASMKVQADQIGITAEQMQVLHLAGMRVGTTNEEVDIGIKRLTVSMGKAELGAKKQQDIFKALGVDYHQTAAVAIPQLVEGLSKVGDASKRHALEVALMGRAAVQMDPLLKQGAEGLKRFGEEAEKAGLILSNEMTEKAHEADVKLNELITTLKIDFSKEVINNADAIVGLAHALESLVGAAINFIGTYPKLSAALAGAAAGSRFGLPGAVGGGFLGFLTGYAGEQSTKDANTNLPFRRRQLEEARTALNNSKAVAGAPGFYANQQREFDKQQALYNAALEQARSGAWWVGKPAMPKDNIPTDLLGGGGHHRARAPTDHTLEWQKQFEDQSARLDEQILQAKRANYDDVSQLADFDRQAIEVETKKLHTDLDIQAQKNPILAAHKQELSDKIDQVAAQRKLTISTEEMLKRWNDDLDMQRAANDNQRELLSVQDQLAVTQADHRRIQLQILDAEKKNLELELQKALLNSKDVKERERIQAQMAAIPAVYAAKGEVVRNQTMTPGEAYMKQLNDASANINDAIDNIKIAGLQSLNDELTQAIMGAKSLGDAFRAVANQIISDLLRIAIQETLIKPLANALFGGSGGGGGLFGGLLGGIFGGGGAGSIAGDSLGGSLATMGAFASGTDSAPRGLALVGEHGPEVVRFRGGEQVIPNNVLRNSAANDRGGDTYHVYVNGAMTEREGRATARQITDALNQRQASVRRYGIA